MERRFDKHNDYAIAALCFSLLSLIGVFLSILDVIPLITTSQLLHKAKELGLDDKSYHIIDMIYQTAIFLTICITVLYLSIQL